MSGITFFVCFGRWGRIKAEANADFARLCLGWISFWVMFHDFEWTLAKLIKASEKADAIIAKQSTGTERADG